jgi:hypothetical protein
VYICRACQKESSSGVKCEKDAREKYMTWKRLQLVKGKKINVKLISIA